MSSLPVAYASESELAATDAMRDSQVLAQTRQNGQNGSNNQLSPSSQERFSASLSQPLSPSATNGSTSSRLSGLQAIPKEFQRSWQSISQKGAYQYQGNTFAASMSAHMPTQLAVGHADGPQHLSNAESNSAGLLLGTLPDAEHRQAWSTQPTFRWFKRSDYDGVPDRWSAREGLKGRGDSRYRPVSIVEQQRINARVEARKQKRGAPRTGEW